MNLNPEKRFTKESLAAHNKRFHKEGEYICKVCLGLNHLFFIYQDILDTQ